MYRILFIEAGEYLYCIGTEWSLNLYSKYEVDKIIKFGSAPSFQIYEVFDREEAIKKLTNDKLDISINDSTDIIISTNLLLFEIVEV